MVSDLRSAHRKLPKQLTWLLTILLDSNLIEAIGTLWRVVKRPLMIQAHEGMYEVLAYGSRLELRDSRGKTAVFHKLQRVRFLQDNIIAYQDQAWGDGEIFADYKCSPGIAVDRYREGHRWRVLISLRETKQRGDVEKFHIRREIRDGFTKSSEAFQTEINHRTRALTTSVVFPKSRHPRRVTLIEQNLNRSTQLGPRHLHRLPDGRLEATWHTGKPRLFEAYILQWEW